MRRARASRLPDGSAATRFAERSVAATALAGASVVLAACAADYRPPELLGGTDLVYPINAHAAGVEGRVLVRYDVTADGRVENAAVVSAEPNGVFENAALAAVRSWRFRPSSKGGKPVKAPGRVSEVAFRIGQANHYDDAPRPKPPD